MAVLGPLSYTLEVPDLETGVRFYTDAGLKAEVEGDVARLRCEGQDRDSVVLLGGRPQKRLHHVSLRADDLDGMAHRVEAHGGRTVTAPEGFEDNGLWVEDPHGMLIRLTERPADPELAAGSPFAINAPGALCARAARPRGRSRPTARSSRGGWGTSCCSAPTCRPASPS